MTFPIETADTVWQPGGTGVGEFSLDGPNDIIDPSDNYLVDPSGNQIIDTGSSYSSIDSTIWEESPGS